MAGRINVNEILKQLRSTEARCRDIAAAEIGDLLEADYLNKREFEKAVKTLIKAALSETDIEPRVSMYNSLSYASELPQGSEMNWDGIAATLPGLDHACLEHALVILGYEGSKYRKVIEPYLSHPDKDVRDAASEALEVIEWKKKQRSKRRARVG